MTTRLIFLLTSLTLLSCNKDSNLNENDSQTETKYTLTKITSDIPIDLNFDGVKNTDLTKELSLARRSTIYLMSSGNRGISDLYWFEPKIDNRPLFSELPSRYEEGMNVEYVQVQRSYNFELESNRQFIRFGSPLVSDLKQFTLQHPKESSLQVNQSELYFKADQSFLTKEGVVRVNLDVTFKVDGSAK